MGKCCFRSIIGIVIVLVLIIVAVVVVLNMTPAKLGFADIKIMGEMSLRDMGFADMSIINIIKSIKALTKVNEDTIITNTYDEEKDSPKAEANFANSNISSEGNIDYLAIAKSPVLYDKEYLLTYDDTTVAYIFHSMIADAAQNNEDDSVEFLRKINADIKEVTISKTQSSTSLRIVIKINLEPLKAEITQALGNVASILPIPNAAYIVSYFDLSADENGKIITVGKSIKINDTDNALSDAIFGVLATKAQNAGEEGSKDTVMNKMGEAFCTVIKHLGIVGTASVDEQNVVILGSKVLGNSGIYDHKFTLITNTAENYIQE